MQIMNSIHSSRRLKHNLGRNKIDSVLFNIAYVSVFFMYFQITPLSAETQPIVVLAFVPVSLVYLIWYGRLTINKSEKWLFAFWNVLLLYALLSLTVYKQDPLIVLNYSLRLLALPLAYMLFLKNISLLQPISVKIPIYVLMIVSLIELFRIPLFYDLLSVMYLVFFNRVSFGQGSRGLCILTTEPSYFVYFAILLVYSMDYLLLNNKMSERENSIYKIVIFFMGFLTKSALVYFFILLYSIEWIIRLMGQQKYRSILLCLVLLLLPVGVIVLSNVSIKTPTNRFTEVLYNFSISFKTNGLLNTILFADASGGFRIIINLLYYLSIFVFPLGCGFGGMADKWGYVANCFNIDVQKNGHFVYGLSDSMNTLLDAQAYIPNIVGTVGCFVVVYLLFLFTGNVQKNRWLKNSILVCLFFYFFVLQSNFFNPVFWILIGIIKSEDSIH